VAALCQRLPATDTPEFTDEFHQLYNDTLLVTYLSTMTKVLSPNRKARARWRNTAGRISPYKGVATPLVLPCCAP